MTALAAVEDAIVALVHDIADQAEAPEAEPIIMAPASPSTSAPTSTEMH